MSSGCDKQTKAANVLVHATAAQLLIQKNLGNDETVHVHILFLLLFLYLTDCTLFFSPRDIQAKS